MNRPRWTRSGYRWLLVTCATGGALMQTNGCVPDNYLVGLTQSALNGIGSVLVNELLVDPFRDEVRDQRDEAGI